MALKRFEKKYNANKANIAKEIAKVFALNENKTVPKSTKEIFKVKCLDNLNIRKSRNEVSFHNYFS